MGTTARPHCLADAAPTGTYKVVLPYIASGKALWLVKLQEKDGKLAGEITASDENVPMAKVTATDGSGTGETAWTIATVTRLASTVSMAPSHSWPTPSNTRTGSPAESRNTARA